MASADIWQGRINKIAGFGGALSTLGSLASSFGIGRKTSSIAANNKFKEQSGLQLQMDGERAVYMPKYIKKGFEDAGIHPLYGMSGGSAQFSPSMPITSETTNSAGGAMQQMGQNISRASEAMISVREKLQNRLLETQVEGQEIDNAKKASDLAVLKHANTPGLNNVPIKTTATGRNTDGSLTYLPSEDIADRIDAMGEIGGIPMALEWYLRNKIPLHKRQLFEWLQSKQSPDSRINKSKKGYKKFVHMFKTMYNRYAR